MREVYHIRLGLGNAVLPKEGKMPKDTNLSLQNSFVMVSIEDLQRLQAANASGLVMRTWIALRSFMWGNKRTAFPSLKAIAERMGYDTTQNYERTIGRTLKWLEDNGFIKRAHRRSKERFTLLRPDYRTGQDSPIVLQGQNSPEKQTLEAENSLTPFNPPTDAGGTATKKQRVRSQRRRKRLRKRDLRHIAEVAEKHTQEERANLEAIEAYKDAHRSRQKTLERLYNEHQGKDTPKTTTEATSAYFRASILHREGWIDELPERPTHIESLADIWVEDPENHNLLWILDLSLRDLWKHIDSFEKDV